MSGIGDRSVRHRKGRDRLSEQPGLRAFRGALREAVPQLSLSGMLAAIEAEVPTMPAEGVLEAIAGTARLMASLEARNVALAAQETRGGAEPTADLLDAKTAARRLGLSLPCVYRMARAGELPAVRVGADSVRFDPADLAAWIDAKKGGRP